MRAITFGNDLSERTRTGAMILVVVALIVATDLITSPIEHSVLKLFVGTVGAYVALYEWPKLGRQPHRSMFLWVIAGWVYAFFMPTLAAYYLLDNNPGWLLWSVGMTVCADVAAYLSGRALGGRLLWPALSPKKTLAGSVGAVVACSVLALLPWGPADLGGKLGAAGLVVIVSTAGDLFESWLKRQAGVKDSGSLLPGHGGLFDRVDGHIAAITLTAALLWWMG